MKRKTRSWVEIDEYACFESTVASDEEDRRDRIDHVVIPFNSGIMNLLQFQLGSRCPYRSS